MEAETIDLTDPLEQLLRQTGWSPEYLQDRLVKLSEENAKRADKNVREIKDMTLSDLLGDFQCANVKTGRNIEPTETIELSDDESSDEAIENVVGKDDSEIQEVNEVQVIELDDGDDDVYYNDNEDDDDEFLEESATDFNEKLDSPDFKTNNDNDLPSLDSTKLRKNENLNKISDIDNNIDSNVSDRNDEGQKENENDNLKNIRLVSKETDEIMENPSEYETLTKSVSMVGSRSSSSVPSKDFQVNSNLLEDFNCQESDLGFIISGVQGGVNLIDSSIETNNTSDGDAEELSTMETEKNAFKNNDSAYENKALQNNPDTCLVSDTSDSNASKSDLGKNNELMTYSSSEKTMKGRELDLVVPKIINNSAKSPDFVKSSCDLQVIKTGVDTKSIRKSIEEIIEQLDMACQDNNSIDDVNLECNVRDDVIHTNVRPCQQLLKKSQPYNSMEEDDSLNCTSEKQFDVTSSTSLLLKSLDEAIETCDKNTNLSQEESVEQNIEFVSKSNASNFTSKNDLMKNNEKVKLKDDRRVDADKAIKLKDSKNETLGESQNSRDSLEEKTSETESMYIFKIKTPKKNKAGDEKTEADNLDNLPEVTNDIGNLSRIEIISGDSNVDIASIITKITEEDTSSKSESSTNDCLLIERTNLEGSGLYRISDKNRLTQKNCKDSVSARSENLISNICTERISENLDSTFEEIQETIETFENAIDSVKEDKEEDNPENFEEIRKNLAGSENLISNTCTASTCKHLDKTFDKSQETIEKCNTFENAIDSGEEDKEENNPENLQEIRKNLAGSENLISNTCTASTSKYLDKSFVKRPDIMEKYNIFQNAIDSGEENNSENFQEIRKNLAGSENLISNTCMASTSKHLDKTFDKSQDKMEKHNIFQNAVESEEEDKEENPENFEEIRKNLKLQLSSLRNKKKMNMLHDVKTKVINTEFPLSDNVQPFEDLNKCSRIYDKTIYAVEQGNIVDLEKTTTTETTEKKREDEQKGDAEKQVIDAKKQEDAKQREDEEKQEDEGVHNVFNEIRKIIRKQKTTPKSSSIFTSIGAEIKNVDNKVHKDNKKEDQISNEADATDTDNKLQKNTDLQNLGLKDLEAENGTPKKAVNSPFVSNSLDEFLTDSKLNVSYTIPKSGAEEGLRQNYADQPVMPTLVSEVKEEGSEKPTQEIKYKPKTLAEKRRLLERSQLKEKRRREKLKKQEQDQKRSYVLFKDKKIFLKAKSVGECIASVESTISVSSKNNSERTTPKKPSLLTELYKKATTPVKYRPGPLCKKHLLQTDYSNWTTELKTLPKIIIKVMPQLGKPVHPNLLHIVPRWDGEVTDDQIEFALSALVTKEDQKQGKIFKFDVPYANHQIEILTRKKILDKPDIRLKDLPAKKENSSPEDDVAGVIESLLKYVEIKELAPSLIKYDNDFTASEEPPLEPELVPQNNHMLVKRKSRFTKTDRELMRLNCKVVSVEVEENEPEKKCFKPYCRLGCLCKSLQCERIIGLHCQKIKCIFGCTCPKEKDKIISIAEPTIKLPAGTDLLSTDTVTRIEGEAKRNLAKLEKEFTQTVIHTNDKTIVVGFGNKPRRATKTPKKYTDFFDDEILKDDSTEPKKKETIPIRPCYVDLDKWDFSDIIPYCLVHHLYNCHCRGFATFSSFVTSKKQDVCELATLKKEEKTLVQSQYPKRTVEESFKAIVRKNTRPDGNLDPEDDSQEPFYSVTGRPLRKKKKIYEADFVFEADASTTFRKPVEIESDSSNKIPVPGDSEPRRCSRTRKIPYIYRKSKPFKYSALSKDFANNLTEADLLKAQLQENEDNLSDSDYIKRTIIEDRKKLLAESEIEIRKNKRKQKIDVRKDENIIIKTSTTEMPTNKQKLKGKVKPAFKGEIIVNDSEWLKKLGQNAKQPLEGYARILPWTALLHGFLAKAINVYCITDMPLRLLLNVGPKLTGKRILDIEEFGSKILETQIRAKAPWLISQSENVRDIIKWLLSGVLPSRYKTTCLSFLLVETVADQFEVRGLCTQGEDKEVAKKQDTTTADDGELSDQVTEVKHKNMNNEIKSLFITRAKFRLRELVEDGFDDDMTDNLYMWVGLPEVYKVAKWRVVFLNNDFAFLYFKNIKYSIKYTDLMKLTEMAKEEKVTLVLRNLQIRRSYQHTSFGIYVCHNYTDRIFIGPYFINYDQDDIETLRYINQSLVSTESFNKMTGNSDYRCGHWMYERPYYHTPTVFVKDSIDLTSDENQPKPKKTVVKETCPEKTANADNSNCLSGYPTTSESTSQPLALATKAEHIIYHNGIPIHIKNSKPRTPSEFNRFIITNIPHFGYLGAYQPEKSSTLEVSWPFEKKVLEFENADNARDFLQERFNQLLQPVPETFKIQVIVLLKLDLKEHQPINSDFLSGHCICGYFGTYNFRELSDEFCTEKLNISKEEITKLFAKRAHAYIKRKIEELADVVGVKQNDQANFNVPTILAKAKEEIAVQENTRKKYIAEIQALELMAVDKMKKIYGLVNDLPVKQRNIESKIIKEILEIRPKRLSANEIVEIKDDDDDAIPQEIKTDPVIYSIDSDDEPLKQPIKKPVKRKRVNKKKEVQASKMAKVTPLTSIPSSSSAVSILRVRSDKELISPSDAQNAFKKIDKPNIVIVRPRQSSIETSMQIDEDYIPMEIDVNEIADSHNNDIENMLGEDSVDHYVIEYDDPDSSNTNVTEIIVSPPSTEDNIDLSTATVIACIPPTNHTTDDNGSLTVSIASPESFSPTSSMKPYPRMKESVNVSPVCTDVDRTDSRNEKCFKVPSSKELTDKIKIGLLKIMKKSDEQLPFLKEHDKETGKSPQTCTKLVIQNGKVVQQESGT